MTGVRLFGRGSRVVLPDTLRWLLVLVATGWIASGLDRQKGQGADATVTVCHSKTRDLAAVAREGEILIAAMGRAAFVTGEFIRPGATVTATATSCIIAAQAQKVHAANL